MNLVRQREVCESLAAVPSGREIGKALGQLKNGKAAGKSNILPEMLKAGRRDEGFSDYAEGPCFNSVGRAKSPSRLGGCHTCANPHEGQPTFLRQLEGHSTIGCSGKVSGQDCAEQVASVGGERASRVTVWFFWRGHSCTDMIFMVWQFEEKVIEHQTKQFLVFMDLRKA